jgi:hypothetical protein
LLKQPLLSGNDFASVLHMIENSISVNLQQKGSMGKFIFKNVAGDWFFTSEENGRLKIHKVEYGFWNHWGTVFSEKE